MENAQVTIVVTPRERFSHSLASLESIYRHTDTSFKLVYVDGNFPEPLASQLKERAIVHGFELVRTNHYLSPNQARNMAMAFVTTPYVAFVDNDLYVSPGWLSALLRCAEETGASIVSPIYLEGKPDDGIIHMAGGACRIDLGHDGPQFFERHLLAKRSLDEVRPSLERGATELFEFHCVLMRTDLLEQLGPFDEELKSLSEHSDVALLARQAGHTIMLEPDSVVTYDFTPPLEEHDLAFFRLRWSPTWNQGSVDRFYEKWRLASSNNYRRNALKWARQHRLAITLNSRPVVSVLGAKIPSLLTNASFKFFTVQGALSTRIHRVRQYARGRRLAR